MPKRHMGRLINLCMVTQPLNCSNINISATKTATAIIKLAKTTKTTTKTTKTTTKTTKTKTAKTKATKGDCDPIVEFVSLTYPK